MVMFPSGNWDGTSLVCRPLGGRPMTAGQKFYYRDGSHAHALCLYDEAERDHAKGS